MPYSPFWIVDRLTWIVLEFFGVRHWRREAREQEARTVAAAAPASQWHDDGTPVT